jgi:hypothetical protein
MTLCYGCHLDKDNTRFSPGILKYTNAKRKCKECKAWEMYVYRKKNGAKTENRWKRFLFGLGSTNEGQTRPG